MPIRIIIFLLLLPTIAFGIPEITILSGDVKDLESVVITGSGFGSSGPTVKIMETFDDNASAIDGGDLTLTDPRFGQWSAHGTEKILYDTESPHSGGFGGRIYKTGVGKREIQLLLPENPVAVIIVYWVNIPTGTYFPGSIVEGEFPNDSAFKFNWFMNGDNGDANYGDMIMPSYSGAQIMQFGGNSYSPSFRVDNGKTNNWWAWGSGNWVRIMAIAKADPTNPATSNGLFFFQGINGSVNYTTSKTTVPVFNPTTFSGEDVWWDRVKIPGWLRTLTDDCRPIYDDIYIAIGDNVQARVEIGNESTYNSCTNLTILTPTAWATDEITVTVNEGSFETLGGNYIYVIDSDGNVSDGFLIPSDTTPPTVTAFAIPSTYTSIPVPVTTFTSTDDVGVTGYIVTASAVAPAYTESGWTPSPPTELDFLAEGANTVYAWAKDAAGNVSTSATDDCTVTLPEPGITWEVQPTWSVTWEVQPTWSVTWE